MKTIQRNKIKYKIFEEEELREKLGMNQKDIGLVLEYQKIFPELLQNECGFCIDGEQLCLELKVKSNFNDWLLRKTKGKEGKLIKYRCVENTDFICLSEKSETQRKDGQKGKFIKNKIMLTLECAKKIAMRQNNERGDLVCNYFILMENILRNYESWILTRNPQKENANKLKSELKKWAIKNHMDADYNGLYAREFNMINQNLVGKTALEIKTFLGYKDKQTREHLTQEINSAIDFIQTFDINLIKCNQSFEVRNNMIQQICNDTYANLKEILK